MDPIEIERHLFYKDKTTNELHFCYNVICKVLNNFEGIQNEYTSIDMQNKIVRIKQILRWLLHYITTNRQSALYHLIEPLPEFEYKAVFCTSDYNTVGETVLLGYHQGDKIVFGLKIRDVLKNGKGRYILNT